MGNCLRKQKEKHSEDGNNSSQRNLTQVETNKDASELIPKGTATTYKSSPDAVLHEDNIVVEFKDQEDGPKVSQEPASIDGGTADFSCLTDGSTVSFIRRSQTMFIMRGVSGSGKSTLVRLLQEKYPDARVCSADHFFTDEEGNYRFDIEKLGEAHSSCQSAAETCCSDGCPVVIIDNTNIQKWEMGYYLQLAQRKYYYHVIIVEPKTPWRFDPVELARRNHHGLEENTLRKKVKDWKKFNFTPIYYGWFLTKSDSQQLGNMAVQCWKECLTQVSEMNNYFTDATGGFSDLDELFSKIYKKCGSMFHCTAKFCGGRGDSHKQYHENQLVQKSMGKVFTLVISGFTFTPRTIGARIKLDKQELQLFEKPEENQRGGEVDGKPVPAFPKGVSAHLTITSAYDVEPKVTGNDILEIVDREMDGILPTIFQTDSGEIRYFEEGICEFRLRNPVTHQALFTGFYPIIDRRPTLERMASADVASVTSAANTVSLNASIKSDM